MDDFNDDLDSIFLAENRAQEDGYRRGLADGTELGLKEGTRLGITHGSAIGSELGFYHGFIQLWLEVEASRKTPREKVLKTMNLLLKLIDDFPKEDPQDERIHGIMVEIRAKFKQVCVALKVSITNTPQENALSF